MHLIQPNVLKNMQAPVAQTIRTEIINNLRGDTSLENEGNSHANPNTSRQYTAMRGNINVDDLMHRINLLDEQIKTPTQTYENIKTLLSQPFNNKIHAIKAPEGFKMPVIEPNNGLSDPIDHLYSCIAQMEIAKANDHIMCKTFSSTRKGAKSSPTLKLWQLPSSVTLWGLDPH